MADFYLQHFGLQRPPFGITPDAAMFFAGGQRAQLLRAIRQAVVDTEGVVVVRAEVGCGKTMLARLLAQQLRQEGFRVLYVVLPPCTLEELWAQLLSELGEPWPGQGAQPALVRLQQRLLELPPGGRNVIIVDDAHVLDPLALEGLKLLANLETAQHKLVQLVLFGQPEINDLLNRHDLRQVRDRVVHAFDLPPLERGDVAELAAYLDHRLRAAGYAGGPLFEPEAIEQIARSAGGRFRRINVLAERALIAAWLRGDRRVKARDVRRAMLEDLESRTVGQSPPRSHHPQRRVWVAVTVVVLAAAGTGLGWLEWRKGRVPAVDGSAMPGNVPHAAGPVKTTGEVNDEQALRVEQRGAGHVVPSSESEPAAAGQSPLSADVRTEVRPGEPFVAAAAAQDQQSLPSPWDQRARSLQDWLNNPGHRGWFWQLGIAYSAADLRRFERTLQGLEPLHALPSPMTRSSSEAWLVLWGPFETRAEALQARTRLSASQERWGPQLRTTAGLRRGAKPPSAEGNRSM